SSGWRPISAMRCGRCSPASPARSRWRCLLVARMNARSAAIRGPGSTLPPLHTQGVIARESGRSSTPCALGRRLCPSPIPVITGLPACAGNDAELVERRIDVRSLRLDVRLADDPAVFVELLAQERAEIRAAHRVRLELL